MTVTYRSIARIDSKNDNTEHLIVEQFRRWLWDDPKVQPRRFSADKLAKNALTIFSEKAECISVVQSQQDGSQTIRYQLSENKPENNMDQKWTSTLTIHRPGRKHQGGFFSFEVDSPWGPDRFGVMKPKFASPPGFMTRILELDEIELFDGEFARMRATTEVIEADQIEMLIDIACDPERRGSLLLMGTDESKPFQLFHQRAKEYFSRLNGIATSFVLTPDATREFEKEFGPSHAVFPNSVRTYKPLVDPATLTDARRHPYINSQTLESYDPKRIAGILLNSCRGTALDSPLPRAYSRIETRLLEEQNKIRATGERIFAYTPQKKIEVSMAEAVLESSLKVAEVDKASRIGELDQVVRQDLGLEALTTEVLSSLIEQASRVGSLSSISLEMTKENQQLKQELAQLRDDLNDLAIDHQETYENKVQKEREINYLRSQLEILGEKADDAKVIRRALSELSKGNLDWIHHAENAEDKVPSSFLDFIVDLERLSFISFTGEWADLEELDKEDYGAYAGRTWEGLRTLNSYAQMRSEREFNGGLKQFLTNPVQGYYVGWPSSKYAANESESVERSEALKLERTFPVPKAVDPSGKVIMFAHLQVGQKLRVHFYDDIANTGKIYVGHIGRHLTTVSTN